GVTGVELADLLRVVRERWWAVAAGVALGLCLGFAVTAATGPVYQSETTVLVNGQVTLTDNAQAGAQDTLSQNLAATYVELVRSRPVAEGVVRQLGLTMSAETLQRRLTSRNTPSTSLVTLDATAGTPDEAQRIAEATVEEFVRQATALATPRSGGPAVRLDIVEPASLPGSPIAPQPVRNLAVGGLLGALAGLAVSVLRDRGQRPVTRVDRLERDRGIPVL